MATFISGRTDFQSKRDIRHKEGHYIVINESIYLEDITILNIYGPNIGMSK